jgi:type VII secretion-associated serine protease mycosin
MMPLVAIVAVSAAPAVRAVSAASAVSAATTALDPTEVAELGQDPGRYRQWPLDLFEAEAVWRRQRADDVVVAVIDTGVDADHPDLAGNVVPGWDAFTPSSRGLTDPNGHGTGVAGIIGATVGNGIGIAGFAPDVAIMPIRVLDRFRIGSVSDVEEGIRWAADNGADVINLSFGSPSPSPEVRDAIADATLSGVLVIASAGNSFATDNAPRYPAAGSQAVSVSAVNRDIEQAWFSTTHSTIDIAAPGVDIVTTALEGDYAVEEGTSFAAPYASATAALLKARYPRATPRQLASRLADSGTDIGPPGRDDLHGSGLLDPLAALGWQPESGCRVVESEPLQSDALQSDPLVRVWDDNRVGTTAAAACTFWPAGGVRRAVIARADTYPDALSGTPLAARFDAPLLLTNTGELPSGVAQVLAQLGVREVFVLGGQAAVSSRVEAALEDMGVTVERLAGENRFDTAARVAGRLGTSSSGRVIVVTGRGFADAVASGAYMAGSAPPVLLTEADALPPATLRALVELRPSEIVVVGGTRAISPAVVEQLAAFAQGNVRRVAGDDRYATSAAALADARPTDGPIVLATGAAFPDALAAGAVTARLDGALLLVQPNDAERAVQTLAAGSWTNGILLGGAAAISEENADALSSVLSRHEPPPGQSE